MWRWCQSPPPNAGTRRQARDRGLIDTKYTRDRRLRLAGVEQRADAPSASGLDHALPGFRPI
jgi:hypothetical protein